MTNFHQPDGAVGVCWSCKGPMQMRSLFCGVCQVVQPPLPIDHFIRLGLARDYAIDRTVLDRQYFQFQRALHPDRFSGKSPREKALSQQQAVSLNEAYETLKDPLKRAAYMLKMSGRTAEPAADPLTLMEFLERHEELSEADAAGTAKIVEALPAEMRTCQESLAKSFATGNLDEASRLTARLKFLNRLADEARLRKARSA
jgi:molecular chaperone HscB